MASITRPDGVAAEVTQSKLIAGVARVDLRVRDIAKSLGFYGDVVGLDVVHKQEQEASLAAPGGPVLLTLDSSGVEAPALRRATGLYHTAIRFPSRADLADVLARLAEAGYRIGVGDHGVSEALYVDDPDGNGVELYRDRPTRQWPAPPPGQRTIAMSEPIDLEGLLSDGRGGAAVGDAAPGLTDIGHVHLQASDLERTKSFFVDVLGLDLMMEFPGQAGFFSSQGYHHHIGANTWHSRGQGPAPRNHAGLERVVLAVSDRNELESARDRLEAGGHSVTRDGDELIVRDPDDIELRFA